MPSKLVKTETSGVYRRHNAVCAREGRCDCPYVVEWRENHEKRRAAFRTLSEAKQARAEIRARLRLAGALAREHGRGFHREEPRPDCPDCERTRTARRRADPLLHEYARAWIGRYQGTGKRGFREETREEYRLMLERYALRYFPAHLKLGDVTPLEIAELIGWLVKQPNHRGGVLSDKSVRNALAPLSACLATAKREGLILANPVIGAALPHRPRIEEDDELPRPFPRLPDGTETMELVVGLVHPAHRLMFELLAATGLRRSELLALEGRHLALDGAKPYVKVRQRTRAQKGKGQVIGPLKSRHARRDLPLPVDLADRLRALHRPSGALLFPGLTGRPYDPAHLYSRVLQPACQEAGVEWAGFHTFRHTVASRMFAAGRNAVQVQRWLGHHSASFTLDTYVHLLNEDLGDPLTPARVGAAWADFPQTAVNTPPGGLAENVEFAG